MRRKFVRMRWESYWILPISDASMMVNQTNFAQKMMPEPIVRKDVAILLVMLEFWTAAS